MMLFIFHCRRHALRNATFTAWQSLPLNESHER